MTLGYYNKNSYTTPSFKGDSLVSQKNILTKPIEKVQKTIETGVDAIIATPNENEKNKK